MTHPAVFARLMNNAIMCMLYANSKKKQHSSFPGPAILDFC